MVVCEW